jgi:hypothetical protein
MGLPQSTIAVPGTILHGGSCACAPSTTMAGEFGPLQRRGHFGMCRQRSDKPIETSFDGAQRQICVHPDRFEAVYSIRLLVVYKGIPTEGGRKTELSLEFPGRSSAD